MPLTITSACKAPKKFKFDDSNLPLEDPNANAKNDVSQPLKSDRETRIPDNLTQGSKSNITDPVLLFLHRELTNNCHKLFNDHLKK